MKRVLVIDDEVAVLRHFMVLLTQSQRYEITVLSDSTRALETVGAGKFDAVLLDMAMPGVHGREVLRGVREHHPETAVIVITGVEDSQLAVEAMQLGAFDYLYKPVGEDQLMLTLDRALEECASGREAV
ncbi:MAG: response regulator [Candidatus Methylomirabilota bacterium]|jgi:DNA-binding NtrC family response regulator